MLPVKHGNCDRCHYLAQEAPLKKANQRPEHPPFPPETLCPLLSGHPPAVTVAFQTAPLLSAPKEPLNGASPELWTIWITDTRGQGRAANTQDS